MPQNSSAISDQLVTADELLEHPEMKHCELVNGKVVPMSPAGSEHGGIAGLIAGHLFVYSMSHAPGRILVAEAGFLISRNPDTVRAPDLMYIETSRLPDGKLLKGFLTTPPDVALEVVSPTDTFSEVVEKAESYVSAGVRLVWVIDPQTLRAYVFRKGKPVNNLTQDDVLSGEDVLPGFELALNEIFR